jgi:hypothetical protein
LRKIQEEWAKKAKEAKEAEEVREAYWLESRVRESLPAVKNGFTVSYLDNTLIDFSYAILGAT